MDKDKQPKSISRKDFLNLLKVGGATTIALSGCGRMARYVTRQPYTEMPEYQLPGESVHYATTCQECPAACGIIVRTVEGRAIKVEGNPDHPVNHGKTCSRGQASVQGLYDPDRFQGPVRQNTRGSGQFTSVTWEEAVKIVSDLLRESTPEGMAFYLGLAPDHVFDFFSQLTGALGARPPYRYGALGLFEARRTLIQASDRLFGREEIPFFDIAGSEVTLSFGADFTETWLSPVAYSHAYGRMRQGDPAQRGYLFHFSSRMSQTAANADQWIPIKPGSEGHVALALGRIAAETRGGNTPPVFRNVDVSQAAEQAGLTMEKLTQIGKLYGQASRRVALPGGQALSHNNGLENALSILSLNTLGREEGDEGGMFFIPEPALQDSGGLPNSLADIQDLVSAMENGEVETLFIHGTDPVFELPQSLGFKQALEEVDHLVSFSPFKDETSQMVDYVFPDHTALESWGYQRHITASDRMVLSGAQPVVGPLHDTQATIDIFLSAIHREDESSLEGLDYDDEVDFLQQTVAALMGGEGFYDAEVLEGFWSKFLQHGGWWAGDARLEEAVVTQPLPEDFTLPDVVFEGDTERDLHLQVYPLSSLGDGRGANRPWLQETPNAMTTVMWNTWVEINPATAAEMGLEDGDILEIQSSQEKIKAAVYLYPGIRPDTIAVPYGQGHQALGRYAENRGANPLKLLALLTNEAGDLAYSDTMVRIAKTGQKMELSRYESREGVYGSEGGE